MKVETRERIIKETVYIADDDTVFTAKEACKYHEWQCNATAVYLVSARGQRAECTEVYSTEELAIKAVENSDVHTVTKVYVDQRFWNGYEDDIDIQAARKYFFEVEGNMGTDEECIKRYKEDHNE